MTILILWLILRFIFYLCVFLIYFPLVITLYDSTVSQPQIFLHTLETFLFIQHRRRCQPFCFGFNAFQHFASWLSSPPEAHLMDLRHSQLHRNESSNLAPSFIYNLSVSHFLCVKFLPQSFCFIVFFACESQWLIISVPPSRSLSAPYLKMKHLACKWLKWMQVHVKCRS